MTDNQAKNIPEFAIVGHPNEGKSSVVSTLAEDDSVRISPVPGETVECQTFPVIIDGQEIIRFTDTPGFQNPMQTLEWMRSYRGADELIVTLFRENHRDNPDFRDDTELFGPIEQGAGIIYVVDGSRPLRKSDKAEMEILRLTGRPRMAVINCKEHETEYIAQWKSEFRKHFNSVRLFNAHRATYAERIELLETLTSIDQDWQPALRKVISAFKQDWENRIFQTADIISAMLADCIVHTVTRNYTEKSNEAAMKKELQTEYNRAIEKIEKQAHNRIRKLFKHNIFNYDLPPRSILHEELFNEKTWQFLGLTRNQLITIAGLTGGAMGAALDAAAAGLTFGIFTAIGGIGAAGWAALGGGKKLSQSKVVGMNLGGRQIRIGPVEQIQFLYILLDRVLIFYSHVINWAHGRRDYPPVSAQRKTEKAGITTQWDDRRRNICSLFFSAVRNRDEKAVEKSRRELKEMLCEALYRLSTSERRYGLIMSENSEN